MPQRRDYIAQSVCHSILHSDRQPSFLTKLPTFFSAYSLTYECLREDLFTDLREKWGIELEDYSRSFSGDAALKAMVCYLSAHMHLLSVMY